MLCVWALSSVRPGQSNRWSATPHTQWDRKTNTSQRSVIETVCQNQDLTAASDDTAYICAQLFQTDSHISYTGCRPVFWEARIALLCLLSLWTLWYGEHGTHGRCDRMSLTWLGRQLQLYAAPGLLAGPALWRKGKRRGGDGGGDGGVDGSKL